MTKEILYVSATWCGLCKLFEPTLTSLLKEEFSNIKLKKLDLDEDFEELETYNIKSVPTAIVLNNGIEISRYSKKDNEKFNITKSKIKEWITSLE